MNTIRRYFLPFILPLLGAAPFCQAQSFSLLHSFTTSEGRIPNGDLTISGSTLYGTARRGGANDSGSVYALSADGSTFQTLHSFTAFGGGYQPYGGVVFSGGTLFGTTISGGSGNVGAIFSLDSDGTDFQILRSFLSNGSDGTTPFATLTLSGTTLYGTTRDGGNNGRGTVFSIGTDGSGYQVRHAFAANASQGANPTAALTLAGSKFYGTTTAGGANGIGTVFSLNLDGSGFTSLYSFAGSGTILPNDLTVSGSTIYGTAYGGGPTNKGYVFSLDITGSNFQMLHSFSGSDGANPTGGLTVVGSTLFGTTSSGVAGTANGTIFSLDTDGSDFATLRSYGGSQTNGARPSGDLMLSGVTLYGVTSSGGSAGNGTAFAWTIPEPASASLFLLGALLCFRRRSLRT
jgi:uncharacterized repeat protein (TIGR03803 family)